MTTEQIAKLEVERNDALMRLGEIQAAVSEMFDLDHTATTADEICKVIHNAIHKYSSQRDSALGDRDQWREVAKDLKDILWQSMTPNLLINARLQALAAYERLQKGELK